MNAIRDGNHIRIYNAFLIKESIKEIDGRFYDSDDKAWLVPYSKENTVSVAARVVELSRRHSMESIWMVHQHDSSYQSSGSIC